MNYGNYFRDIFESIHDYRKVVLTINLFQTDKDLLEETGFSKNDINRLNLEFKILLLEQNEQYLDYIKN